MALDYYEVLAWLPGEYNFLVKDMAQNLGVWTLKGFAPVTPQTLESAITKHGYQDLRKLCLRSMPNQIKPLAEHLNSL